ncbi:MAG: hypothetical protein LZ172_03675 [Thaumarchaeota archaeon]|jgi:hypothetical protein|nr:hypothetical protein [Candidatus Geocrenenecus arthurdayi]MCL7396578.1 hypothetical protein [Candidatus Geocrenenecus arthurdayi]MCL7402664.1 hypothetical protein [Candidatus Geocrenenecus arthurdayi]MCL7403430.1 hypothetical protein [Candidatus Geocrenenecus arthurdayi]
MSSEERISRKLMIAATMLFFKSHRSPGVRGWELKNRLGKNYMKVLELLNHKLNELGLQIKTVFEDDSSQDLDRARFYITLTHPLTMSDLVTSDYRIDEVAALAITLSIIFSRGGKTPLRDVLEVLETKFPKWKAEAYIEKAIRRGYINKTEEDILTIGWRTRVELDQRELLKAILEAQPQQEKKTEIENQEDKQE